MSEKQVAVRRALGHGVLATLIVAAWLAPAWAQTSSTDGYGTNEKTVTRLGGRTTRFSPPMHSIEDLHAMASANRDQISRVLVLAGLGDISAQVITTLTTGDVTEV